MQRAHVRALSGSLAHHYRLQVRTGGEQLVSEVRLARTRSHERLREGYQRRVLRSWVHRSRSALQGLLGALQAPLDRLQQLLSAPAQAALADAPDLLELAQRGRSALGHLHEPAVAEHALHRPVALGRRPLAPLHELARHPLRGGAQAPDARESLEDRVEIALVAHMLQVLALLAGPSQAPDPLEAALELGGELQQVHDVLARIGELLGRERAGVPAREARALGESHPERLRQQRLVRALRGHPQKAGRHLRVEHARHLASERAAQERDVLAPGVHHDLDQRVFEHPRKRLAGRLVRERVDDLDPLSARAVGDRQLDQAQQRAVAALAHELRVEREPPRRARVRRDSLQRRGAHWARSSSTGAAGRRRAKLAPVSFAPARSSSSSSEPPMRSASSRPIAKPRPKPIRPPEALPR